jgi:EpsI family protein
MNSLRPFLPAVILLLGCGFVLKSRSQSAIPLVAPLKTVLPVVEGYRAQDTTLSADEQRVAGMSTYVTRIFWRDTSVAFTTFVSYYERQEQGKTIHSPKNCLPGAGWEVLQAGIDTVNVDGVPEEMNRYVLKYGPHSAVVYYWYQGRGRIVANEYRVKWNLLRDAALVGHTEEALVRVFVPVQPQRDPADTAEATRLFRGATTLGRDISARLAHDVTKAIPAG